MAGNSESVKKSEATKKEKYGTDFHSRTGATGGRARGRGYFGMLKDSGQTDKLKELAHNGAEKSNKVQGTKRSRNGGKPSRGPTDTARKTKQLEDK